MNWKDEIKKETPYPKSPSIDLTTLTKEQLKALGEAQQAIDEFISKFESSPANSPPHAREAIVDEMSNRILNAIKRR
tara:strand:- start:45 stop:275 length:231 start_codon:yes stop_codon:yes gene_type:complete